MKKIISVLFIIIFALSLPFVANALVKDTADMLTNSEIEALQARISKLEDKYGYNVHIYTEYDLGHHPNASQAAKSTLNYLFHTPLLADGKIIYADAILFYVAIDSRDYAIEPIGKCYDIMNQAARDELKDTAIEHLSDGKYYEAFDAYLDVVEDMFEADANGEEYVRPKKMTDLLIYIAIAAVIAFIIAFAWVSILKGQLTSVKFQHGAGAYQNAGSLNVTGSRDTFLYKNVTFVPRPKSNSSSDGGSRRGGGGMSGKF